MSFMPTKSFREVERPTFPIFRSGRGESLTSQRSLRLECLPEAISIGWGSYVGLEFAQIFRPASFRSRGNVVRRCFKAREYTRTRFSEKVRRS